jgi:signal transduction histidine kinase
MKHLPRLRDRLILSVLLAFGMAALFQLFWKTPTALLRQASKAINLEGDWETCVQPDLPRPDPSACQWKVRAAPKALPPSDLAEAKGWVLYRRWVTPDEVCNSSSCSLFIAEVGDAAEIWFDGIRIAQHGGLPPNDRYARHLPLRVDLPSSGKKSTILDLRLRYLKKEQTGILRGPIAILPTEDAQAMARTILTQNVLLPLLSGFGVLLATLLSVLAARLGVLRDPAIDAFIRYGAISSAFLFSYSSVPREFLPLGLTGCAHFMLRFAMDWAYFELTAILLGMPRSLVWSVRVLYALLQGGFLVAFGSQLFFGQTATGWGGFSAAVQLSLFSDFPLVVGPYGMALFLGVRKRRTLGLPLVGVMALLALITLSGTLTFHGWNKLPHFVIFSPFFSVFSFGLFVWGRSLENFQELQKQAEAGRIAAQMAHDIRSPLAALRVLTTEMDTLSVEVGALFHATVDRISEIAASLRQEDRRTLSLQPLLPSIERVVAEKALALKALPGIRLKVACIGSARSACALIAPADFFRVLSNLIDNAIEALAERPSGQVLIQLLPGGRECWKIRVRDDGPGIPSEVLARLGERGFSFGKSHGSGLGVFHARSTLEEWGGQFQVQSVLGQGTEVTLSLPAP